MIHDDILIKELNKEDLYDGQFAMSGGNIDHIYKIKIFMGEILHQCHYKILDRRDLNKYSLHKLELEPWITNSGNFWVETTITRSLNLPFERERKLNQLLYVS